MSNVFLVTCVYIGGGDKETSDTHTYAPSPPTFHIRDSSVQFNMRYQNLYLVQADSENITSYMYKNPQPC